MTGRAAGPGRALAAYKCGSPAAGPPPPAAPQPPSMAAPRWLLALLLLLWLALAAAGPLGQAPDGKDAEDGLIRTLVRPRGVRRGAGHRPGGWRRYRRPRPRLSHKGPMPF
ncbi:apelin [Mycteria americana]|uniref:apelin n=1 Tax=Mycteria americana TaxID=33587 RepID=UPI003F588BE6